jgi:nucleoside-diphosphate-sugar epimerase
VDVVVHLAGTITAVRTQDYFRSNADGTRNLVDSIARCAPEASLVHVSSIAAAGPSADGAGTDLPPDRCKPCSHYGESKRQGELAVIDARRWVILRPPMVYGPNDRATRLLFRSALATVTPVPWADRPISLVHVRDLIQAISDAGRGIAEHRILPIDGPDRLSFHGLPRAMAEVCGQSSRLLPLPVLGLRGAALVADAVALLRRRASFFSLDKVREIAAVGWVADPGPARDALGFRPQIPTSQGLAETARAEGFSRGEPETPA